MRRALLSALVLFALPAVAQAPRLSLPLDCTVGEDCFILNYVDSDPSEGQSDFTCGPRSYDGHKGTDVALLSFDAMHKGVPVFPVAPGTVTARRDGMPDLGLDGTPPEILKGRDCGNGVVIDHGDGWSSQYCHMKRGGVAVSDGQLVTTETVLGQVGYSGRTQFPHIHVTLRHDGAVVDPFNTVAPGACATDAGAQDDLWADPIAYDPGGLVAIGMAQNVPDFQMLKEGGERTGTLPPTAPALVGWALVYGARAGDLLVTVVTRPDGTELVRTRVTFEKDQAMLFRATGRKRSGPRWPEGEYSVDVTLTRGAMLLDRSTRSIRVEADAIISR